MIFKVRPPTRLRASPPPSARSPSPQVGRYIPSYTPPLAGEVAASLLADGGGLSPLNAQDANHV
jgi:hypothetical protein